MQSETELSEMRILISEDNANQAELLARFLQPISSKIVRTTSMAETLQALSIETFDVVTFDLAYPDSSREDSILRIKEIKEKQPTVILIVVTGRYEPGMERVITEAGADGLIRKSPENNTPEGFMAKVKEIVFAIRTLPSHENQIVTVEKAVNRISSYYDQQARTSAA